MAEIHENGAYQIPDALWEKIEPLLPPELSKPEVGHSRMDDRKVMEAILYVFRTGCDWESLPLSLGAGNAVYRRFQKWQKSGLFQRMWVFGLLTYEELEKMIWYEKE